jgi:hypothetical protein
VYRSLCLKKLKCDSEVVLERGNSLLYTFPSVSSCSNETNLYAGPRHNSRACVFIIDEMSIMGCPVILAIPQDPAMEEKRIAKWPVFVYFQYVRKFPQGFGMSG